MMKVLSHTTMGADRTTLLQLYRSLIRSKLDYPGVTLPPCRGLWGTLHIWGRY